jgi:hypothetical protein
MREFVLQLYATTSLDVHVTLAITNPVTGRVAFTELYNRYFVSAGAVRFVFLRPAFSSSSFRAGETYPLITSERKLRQSAFENGRKILSDILTLKDEARVTIMVNTRRRKVLAADNDCFAVYHKALVMHVGQSTDVSCQIDALVLHFLTPFFWVICADDERDILVATLSAMVCSSSSGHEQASLQPILFASNQRLQVNSYTYDPHLFGLATEIAVGPVSNYHQTKIPLAILHTFWHDRRVLYVTISWNF